MPEADDTVKLGDALDQLADTDAALAELVDLKFFCGFSFADIAAMRGVSERTVQRDWKKARLLLHQVLSPGLTLSGSVRRFRYWHVAPSRGARHGDGGVKRR